MSARSATNGQWRVTRPTVALAGYEAARMLFQRDPYLSACGSLALTPSECLKRTNDRVFVVCCDKQPGPRRRRQEERRAESDAARPPAVPRGQRGGQHEGGKRVKDERKAFEESGLQTSSILAGPYWPAFPLGGK